MKGSHWVLLGLTVAGLAGCTNDSASYLIGGNRDHSLSLIREQQFFWSDLDLSFVVTRQPDCMRRHRLKPAADTPTFKLEVYQSLEGGYILHQGKNWYIAETGKCQLQAFAAPPAEPGDLVGAFLLKEDRFQFVAEAKPQSSTP